MSRCRVGRGLVVASQSQQDRGGREGNLTHVKGWTHRGLSQAHTHSHKHNSCSHQPNSHGTEENTHKHSTVLLSACSVRAKDAVHTLISSLTRPCFDPVLNQDAWQTPTQVCIWICVYVCVCSCELSKFTSLFRADIALSIPLPNSFCGYWLITVVTV